MKKILQTVFVLHVSLSCLLGQNEPSTYNNHIGFNTNVIFNGIFQSGATPFSLMYKKQLSEKQALRLGSAIYFNIEDANQGIQKQHIRSFSFDFSVGKEFQSVISKRWVWYGGGDIIPFYGTLTNEQIDTGSPIYQKSTQDIFGLTARPFIGIRFNIASRLYLSTEASLSMTYRKQISTNIIGNSSIDSNADRFTLGLNPATSIYFYYLF